MQANKKVNGFTRDVTRRLQGVLGEELIGVYLHGSAATEDFLYQVSDIDMLAICANELPDEQRKAVADVLLDPEMPCPGSGLEFSLVTDASLDIATKTPAFEVHVTTGPENRKFVDGRGHDGDPDLILHYAMCHARGRAIYGPAPAEIFPEIPRDWVLEAMQDELEWGLENASPHYAILNACRAVHYAETGTLSSKLEGGRWFTQARRYSAVVHSALRRQMGKHSNPLTMEQARPIVEYAQERLSEALWEERAGG